MTLAAGTALVMKVGGMALGSTLVQSVLDSMGHVNVSKWIGVATTVIIAAIVMVEVGDLLSYTLRIFGV